MGDGVTTGSLLNTRVYRREVNKGASSSNKSGGVKTSALLQTHVTLANRHRPSSGVSYTALSNQINGRKEIIYVGGGTQCCGKAGGMSTMDKIAAFNAIAMQGLQLTQGIAGMFKKDGANAPTGVKNTGGSDLEKLNSKQSRVQTFGQDNYSIGSQGLATTISLMDVDYKDAASDFISKMNKADTSQDLYQALQGAKAYKAQLDNRITNMGSQVGKWQDELGALKGEAEGSVSKAEADVKSKRGVAKDASESIKQGERQVETARTSYASAKEAVALKDEKFKNASEEETKLTKDYDEACKKTAEARKGVSTSRTALANTNTALANAKVNTQQARANLAALEAQRGAADAAGAAALEAQIWQARAAVQKAEAAEAEATKTQKEAEAALSNAENQEGLAVKSEQGVKANLTTQRNSLKAMAKDLVDAKKITQEQADLLSNRTSSLEKAEETLTNAETAFDKANDDLQGAEEKLAKLEAKKDELEMKLSDFDEMKKGAEKLSDLSSFETKLDKMMKKESLKEADLLKKLNDENSVSNDESMSAKQKAKAEKQEAKYTKRLTELYEGSALDDIARDTASREGNIQMSLNALSHPGQSATINGKNVSLGFTSGEYLIDGKTMSKEQALEYLKA